MTKKRFWGWRFLAVSALVLGYGAVVFSTAHADETQIPRAAFTEQGIPNDDADELPKPGRKLGRGLANLTTSPFEVLRGMETVGDKHGPVAGVTWGLLQGVGQTVRRTAVGVYEVLSFPFPHTEVGYDPLVYPEFVIEDTR